MLGAAGDTDKASKQGSEDIVSQMQVGLVHMCMSEPGVFCMHLQLLAEMHRQFMDSCNAQGVIFFGTRTCLRN